MSRTDQSPGIIHLGRARVARALGFFWVVFVGLNTLRGLVLGYHHPIEAFERRLAVAVIGAALSWAIYRVLVVLRPSTTGREILFLSLMSLPAAIVFSTVNFLVFAWPWSMPDEACNGHVCTLRDLAVDVSDMSISWTFVFAAWGLLYLSLASAARARAADRRSAESREAARVAQIHALQYQVNPHFLFNILNSLTALVSRHQTAEAQTMISEVGRFFRYGLATDPMTDVPLADEIDMQVRYLELERRRFPSRLSICVDIADAAQRTPVPPLILQPLVENAVKHAVSKTSLPVMVTLRAQIIGRAVLVSVEDNAPRTSGTVSPDALPGTPPGGLGVGLRNVAERLAVRFGDQASLSARDLPECGFRAMLRIPANGR